MTVWDAGLQPERTLLAWRRTCLSFALGSALAVRFTVEIVGVVALAAGVLGVALSLVALIGANRRYRAATRSLAADDALTNGALPLVAAALAAVILGAASGAYLIAGILAEVAG